eukprot:CAMPEP_0180637024 /NCGR_PEP_ID=MMETSP1037_2-20121125/43464_1 /TAXON_ID=632150 /ORGANISM="Azadinium spinosum, Strain 3D9" /LENGTH=33 /DNA_ID= /DNA_START= /DNA_END= /DNA_ORIENTATION=
MRSLYSEGLETQNLLLKVDAVLMAQLAVQFPML